MASGPDTGPELKFKTKLSDFEFRVFQALGKLESVRASKVLVACSGGLDSVALLSALHAMAKKLDLILAVVHVHHGRSDQDLVQTRARDEARDHVQALASQLGLECEIAQAPDSLNLNSEEELRDFRLRVFSRVAEEKGFDFVALAHHADDLFETRLFRLIRGTGAQGLRAMSLVDEHADSGFDDSIGVRKLRPFLGESRTAIRAYADHNQLRWIEDPSNADSNYFRNWLRTEWLPQLEEKRPGAGQSFSRSLETLVQELQSTKTVEEVPVSLGKISRERFEGLELVRKSTLVANLTRSLGVRDFSQSRVEEVIKRLHHLESTGQKNETFSVGGLEWTVSATHISADLQNRSERDF